MRVDEPEGTVAHLRARRSPPAEDEEPAAERREVGVEGRGLVPGADITPGQDHVAVVVADQRRPGGETVRRVGHERRELEVGERGLHRAPVVEAAGGQRIEQQLEEVELHHLAQLRVGEREQGVGRHFLQSHHRRARPRDLVGQRLGPGGEVGLQHGEPRCRDRRSHRRGELLVGGRRIGGEVGGDRHRHRVDVGPEIDVAREDRDATVAARGRCGAEVGGRPDGGLVGTAGEREGSREGECQGTTEAHTFLQRGDAPQ